MEREGPINTPDVITIHVGVGLASTKLPHQLLALIDKITFC